MHIKLKHFQLGANILYSLKINSRHFYCTFCNLLENFQQKLKTTIRVVFMNNYYVFISHAKKCEQHKYKLVIHKLQEINTFYYGS